jgi:hypothetical protein
VGYSISATAAAKKRKADRDRDYKSYRRTVDSSFVAKERAARRRHKKKRYHMGKIAIAFTKAYPEMFARWVRAGMPMAQSLAPSPIASIAPHVPVALSPTSPPIQMKSGTNILDVLGIAKD